MRRFRPSPFPAPTQYTSSHFCITMRPRFMSYTILLLLIPSILLTHMLANLMYVSYTLLSISEPRSSSYLCVLPPAFLGRWISDGMSSAILSLFHLKRRCGVAEWHDAVHTAFTYT